MNGTDWGYRIFVDELARFAAQAPDDRVAQIAEQVAAPLRIAVAGRRGVGGRTVAQALGYAGCAITAPHDADVVVYVVAEAAKPEDTAAVAALRRPRLVVLNKTDLTGCACIAAVSRRIGAPVAPMSGLFALAASTGRLDGTLWAALGVLAAGPATMSCAERFAADPHRVPRQIRLRLCDTLDMPGISQVVQAVRRGMSIGQVRALLRRLSGIDGILVRLDAAGATVRYRRISVAVTQLEALAVSDRRVGDFLAHEDTVVARMLAAIELAESTGVTVDRADNRAAQLRRAMRWQRHRRGPLDALHQACGADIARGSLRLWSQLTEPA